MMMRLWFVFLMTLCLLPVSATMSRAQETHTTPHASVATEVADALGAGAHEAEASSGLPQFDPSSFASQIFWLLIAFCVLYTVFSRRTLPDLSSIIENRKNHIQSDLEQAENLTSQAEIVQATYEKGLNGAREQATNMINAMHDDMQTKKNDQTEAFRVRSENDVRAAEERLNTAKDKAMSEISDIVAEVAAQAVEKIIGVPTDASEARNVVSRLKAAA